MRAIAARSWRRLLGVATLLGVILPFSYGLNLLLNRFIPYRAPSSGERQGMDLHELGAGAYPEFVTHREDFCGVSSCAKPDHQPAAHNQQPAQQEVMLGFWPKAKKEISCATTKKNTT